MVARLARLVQGRDGHIAYVIPCGSLRPAPFFLAIVLVDPCFAVPPCTHLCTYPLRHPSVPFVALVRVLSSSSRRLQTFIGSFFCCFLPAFSFSSLSPVSWPQAWHKVGSTFEKCRPELIAIVIFRTCFAVPSSCSFFLLFLTFVFVPPRLDDPLTRFI